MSIWMWMAIFIALAGGIFAAKSGYKKTERKYMVALLCFIVAVIIFFLWWFNR